MAAAQDTASAEHATIHMHALRRGRNQRRLQTIRSSLSEALKQAIRASGLSEYQLAKAAGVSQIVISRFVSGERDKRMATADKLAEALGLKLAAGK